MLYVENSPSRKCVRHLERVLVVDPLPSSARLLHELLKDVGAKYLRIESTTKGALAAAKEDDPQIIFTEFAGPALDGLEFVRQFRRSDLLCREAPVIMCTAEATAASIIGSRDATRTAFKNALIADGDTWMDMIKARNQTSHTYNVDLAESISQDILQRFYPAFVALTATLSQLQNKPQ